MINPNLKLLGTSHIAKQSVSEVKKAIIEFNPDIIAVELDNVRYHSLKNKSSEKRSLPFNYIFKIGVFGYFFLLIASYLQKKLGKIIHVEPGIDMLTAINLGLEKQKRIELIDRNINITLRRLSKSVGIRDYWNFFIDLIKSPFSKQKISFDLNSVPSDKIIKIMIGHLKSRYPGLYNPLIHERNIFMSARLHVLLNQNPDKKILAIVGAGHLDGMTSLLEKL
jgi:pheromone shutdown-related protein TraB